jgi:hypothetical protein
MSETQVYDSFDGVWVEAQKDIGYEKEERVCALCGEFIGDSNYDMDDFGYYHCQCINYCMKENNLLSFDVDSSGEILDISKSNFKDIE